MGNLLQFFILQNVMWAACGRNALRVRMLAQDQPDIQVSYQITLQGSRHPVDLDSNGSPDVSFLAATLRVPAS